MSEKDKLIEMIETHPDIIRYKKIEKLINEHQELKDKFNELKAIQKQLVNAKQIQKKEAILYFEKQYQELLDTIENYPLMSEYLALQNDINDMLQEITKIIEEGIEEDFSIESLF